VVTNARVVAPLYDDESSARVVRGAVVEREGQTTRIPALLTIAADGRQSTLAAAAGLARPPRRPRRWAVGATFAGVEGLTDLGEMHVRAGYYIGIAPLPGGRANVCHVSEDRDWVRAAQADLGAIAAADPVVGHRFARAQACGPASTLGPMAIDTVRAGAPGLLLAGDAAGFIDPMTGDGMRFALEGGILAARAALMAVDDPATPAHLHLDLMRRQAFAGKWRVNRAVRLVAGHAGLITLASLVGRMAPGVFSSLIAIAGDVPLARRLAGETGADWILRAGVERAAPSSASVDGATPFTPGGAPS
jgi:menaquinone-9 beta-reductase